MYRRPLAFQRTRSAERRQRARDSLTLKMVDQLDSRAGSLLRCPYAILWFSHRLRKVTPTRRASSAELLI